MLCSKAFLCVSGAILLYGGDLQHLAWLGLQWALMGQKPALRDWLKQLFPRLTLETSKLDTNTPESICLLDLEVWLSPPSMPCWAPCVNIGGSFSPDLGIHP